VRANVLGQVFGKAISLAIIPVVGLTLLQAAPCSAAALAAPVAIAGEAGRLDRIVNGYVRHAGFRGAVLVARGDEVILSRGYGMAHPETRTPNTPQTRYMIGSLTKQFTAAAVMLLQDRGELNVNDPLCKYWPECPAAWAPITLAQLLEHTSGIPNFLELPEMQTYHLAVRNPDETIGLVRDKPLEFQPGTRKHYCSTGYLLLGRIIERLSGEPFGVFLRKNILSPLEMADSGYLPSDLYIPHLAGLFEKRPGSERVYSALPWSQILHFSSGGMYSTVGDLFRWERALFGGRVMSSAAFTQMTTDYGNGYGFGLGIGQLDVHRTYRHLGIVEGFASSMTYVPDADTTVIVLSNVRSPDAEVLGDELLRAIHTGGR
jgi:CubicO group peptidase (beta-lactamase class C family)